MGSLWQPSAASRLVNLLVLCAVVGLVRAECFSSCTVRLCDGGPVTFSPLPQDAPLSGALCNADGPLPAFVHAAEASVVTSVGSVPISQWQPDGLLQSFAPSFFKTYPMEGGMGVALGHETPQQNQASFLFDQCFEVLLIEPNECVAFELISEVSPPVTPEPYETPEPTDPADTPEPTDPEESPEPTDPEESPEPTDSEESPEPTDPEESPEPTSPDESPEPTDTVTDPDASPDLDMDRDVDDDVADDSDDIDLDGPVTIDGPADPEFPFA